MAMGLLWSEDIEKRFDAYVEGLSKSLFHADRVIPFIDYCTGLLLPGDRKSVEPMAARLAPERVSAKHQSLLTIVGQSTWSDEAVLEGVKAYVLPIIESTSPICAWIVDDTSHKKKGDHSVGVARQWCGRLGKVENCQVAVTLSVASQRFSLPIKYRLYLPNSWCEDSDRLKAAKVPIGVRFMSKVDISLEQMMDALSQGVQPGVVLTDGGYGYDSRFRDGVSSLALTYCVGIHSDAMVWVEGNLPLPPPPWSGRGRPPSRPVRDEQHKPIQVKQLAKSLPVDAWTVVSWRDGSNATLSSRFAAVRIKSAHVDDSLIHEYREEWLLSEWVDGDDEPSKYWFSTLPAETSIEELVLYAKLRWKIERDYEELKSELGLSHYEGRGWIGFHHHATFCIAAYAFLVAERAAIPPSGPAASPVRQKVGVSKGIVCCRENPKSFRMACL